LAALELARRRPGDVGLLVLRRPQLALRERERGTSVFKGLAGRRTADKQLLDPSVGPLRLVEPGLRARHGLASVLEAHRADLSYLDSGRLDGRLGLIEVRPGLAVFELQQRLPGADLLPLVGADAGHAPGDQGREGRARRRAYTTRGDDGLHKGPLLGDHHGDKGASQARPRQRQRAGGSERPEGEPDEETATLV
jgi:hypothetical protein